MTISVIHEPYCSCGMGWRLRCVAPLTVSVRGHAPSIWSMMGWQPVLARPFPRQQLQRLRQLLAAMANLTARFDATTTMPMMMVGVAAGLAVAAMAYVMTCLCVCFVSVFCTCSTRSLLMHVLFFSYTKSVYFLYGTAKEYVALSYFLIFFLQFNTVLIHQVLLYIYFFSII